MKTCTAKILIFTLTIVISACSPAFWSIPTQKTQLNPQLMEASDNNEPAQALSYPIVDSGQSSCFDNSMSIACPKPGEEFYGQDAQYDNSQSSYSDNGDGTVTDLVTGLMWTQSADINNDGIVDIDDKLTADQAEAYAKNLEFAGYDDWRLPSIKELYSLVMFSGVDPNVESTDTSASMPFIDTDYFEFGYGDMNAGERLIDAQFATSTRYASTTMGGNETMFGYNFADGRIKGYPTDKLFYAFFVRGAVGYGKNEFMDNGNGTISDLATGLTWMQSDSGKDMNWEEALGYCENLDLGDSSDWRLPNAKELQSIVDYGRSPDTTGSPSIDPLFTSTPITNEAGQSDFPFYWTSTTHMSSAAGGRFAVYIAFGRALGYMRGRWIDVHGAGAQRSDPKTGNSGQYPTGHGPQGDALRIDNYVRCVSGGATFNNTEGEIIKLSANQPPIIN